MPEESVRTYVKGMKAAGKEFDKLVAERLVAEAEAEELAKEAEELERKAKETLRGARGS